MGNGPKRHRGWARPWLRGRADRLAQCWLQRLPAERGDGRQPGRLGQAAEGGVATARHGAR
eukprot:627611-Alexandrium_andersonii.AAC.1